MKKRTQDTFRKCETHTEKKNMHESNWASLWLPVNWVTQLVIVSDHQTNSHSYVSALAPFSSGAVPLRPLKAKELTGQGFKPISSFGTAAITTGGKQLLVSSSIWGRVYLCWLHIFFSGVRGEWQRRIPINFVVTFPSSWSKFSLLTIRLSLGLSETSEHLVSTVKPNFKSAFSWRNTENIFSVGHLGHSPGWDLCHKPWNAMSGLDNSLLFCVLSVQWKCFEKRKCLIRNNLLSH